MKIKKIACLCSLLTVSGLLAACASNAPASDVAKERRCPPGQVLVCKGGDANSRVKDSELNTTDVCICRQKDPF